MEMGRDRGLLLENQHIYLEYLGMLDIDLEVMVSLLAKICH